MKEQSDNRAAPPRITTRRPWPTPLVITLVSLMIVGVALLFVFDPARHAFYPVCLFKKMTGYDCPGCGGLRAVHQLLRGDLWHAFQLNPLAVTAFPLLGYWAIRSSRRSSHGARAGTPSPLFWVWFAVAIIVLFGVVRNLSWWPFGVTPG